MQDAVAGWRMIDADELERVGVGAGVVLGDVTTTGARTPFVAAVLGLGVLAGAVAAGTDAVAYETVWAFALGAWLAAVPLVSFATEGRIAVLVVADLYLDDAGYRVLVLVAAAVGGAAVAAGYDRYA
jgi:hypothetical protein